MLTERIKKIWRGLVDYANAPGLDSNPSALKSVAETLFECMPWMARTAFEEDVPAMVGLRTNREDLFGQVKGKRVWLCFKSEEQLANQFRQQAKVYQPQVRQLLRWLSDPKHDGEDKSNAFVFLLEHTQHIEFRRGDPAFEPKGEESRYFTPKGAFEDDFPVRTLFYKDLADVICDFIQREHEDRRIAPIQICKRPGCGNVVTQFKKRKFCRTPSCDRERQRRDDDVKQKQNRDNVFLCRLRQMSGAMRRRKARESVDRLREIERYWRDRNNETLAKHASKLLAEAQ